MPFPPTSRYFNIDTIRIVALDGRVVSYLERRFIPPPECDTTGRSREDPPPSTALLYVAWHTDIGTNPVVELLTRLEAGRFDGCNTGTAPEHPYIFRPAVAVVSMNVCPFTHDPGSVSTGVI